MLEHEQLLSLDIIDYLIDNTNISFHLRIGNKDFLSQMIRLLKSRDSPKTQVKIIGLIKKWGEKFKNSKDLLPYFSNIYESLLANGVTFPEKYSSEYAKYLNITNEDSLLVNKKNSSVNQSLNINDYENNKSLIPTKLILSNDNKKYHKFINEMNIVIDNIQLANQLIDSMNIGDEVDDCLRSIIINLKNCEPGLLKAIQVQIKDESLLSSCLLLNDDLNQTSERYDYIKSGQIPKNFKSAFGWITKSEDKANENKINLSKKKEDQKSNMSKMETIQKPSADIFGLFDNMEISNNQNKNHVDDFNAKQNNAEYKDFDPFSSSTNNIQKNEKINVIDLIDNIGIGRSSIVEKKNEPVMFDFVGNSNPQQQRNSQNNKKNIDDILNSAFNSNSNSQFMSQPIQFQSNLYPNLNTTNYNQNNNNFNQNFNSLYENNSQFKPNSNQNQINKEEGFKNNVFDYQINNQGNDFNKKDKLDGLNPFS